MATLVHTTSSNGPAWTKYYLLYMLWVITWTINRRWFIVVSQSPRVLDLKKPKIADLPKRQLNLSHIYMMPLPVLCTPSGIVSSSFHPSLWKKMGLSVPQTTGIGVVMVACSSCCIQDFITWTFWPYGLFFSARQLRIIVDIITSYTLLEDVCWALESKKWSCQLNSGTKNWVFMHKAGFLAKKG